MLGKTGWFFPLLFLSGFSWAGEFGIVTDFSGRAIVLSSEGISRIIRFDTILNDGDTIFTERETKVTIKTLDGSVIRIYEASQLQLLETVEINQQRDFKSLYRLVRGSIACLFSVKTGEFGISQNEYFVFGEKNQFLFFSSYEENIINLLSPLKDISFRNDSFSDPILIPKGKALSEYAGDILNIDRYIKEPDLGLKIRLDRKNLAFEEDELRTMLVSIQLVVNKTSQNFHYSLPLFFFSNIHNLELPQNLSLNRRGYAYYEIKIPEWKNIRFMPNELVLLVIADFSSGFSIKPGVVELSFKQMDSSEINGVEAAENLPESPSLSPDSSGDGSEKSDVQSPVRPKTKDKLY